MDVLSAALGQLFVPYHLLIIVAGTTVGLFVGAMPGLSATMALAVLLPFTFAMQPLAGLIGLGSVYMGAIYGGAFSAILINAPGTPSSIATTFDGYPMAKAGRAREALIAATIASVFGGLFGVLALLLLAPPLAAFSLRFGPPEYFWVAVLGLTLIGSLSGGALLKGLLGGGLGVVISIVGVSPIGGESRFTYGFPALQGGVELIVALIGLFVIPELLVMAGTGVAALSRSSLDSTRRGIFWPTVKTVLSMPGNILRSVVIGQIVSIIPGAGGNIAGLLAYNEAKRASKHPEEFGKGSIEGLVASESSNNVTVAGSMVPLLTLGIPGAPPDALVLGAMLMHGLRPGAELFSVSGVLTYGFILSMGLSAIVMLPIGLLGGRLIYQAVVRIPPHFLVPTIATMAILGSYALRNSMTDVMIMLVLGIIGYVLKELGFHPAPIALGLILGPIAEMGFVQSMLMGSSLAYPPLKLVESPLSLILVALSVFAIVWPFFTGWRTRRRERTGSA
ncbi:MAG: tripartite tricarboxylate transporter permease [Trueperaceae bacterium]|nr:tripartite tricarboxylate transporter permease [Trueperaceae bacterium]